jgi:hypothetical protein
MGVSEGFTIMEGTLAGRILRKEKNLWRFPASRLVATPGGVLVVERDIDLGHNTITDAAADFLADDFVDASTDVSNMDWHHWGTGACSTPACGATGLVTAASEARVSGAASQPGTRQYRTVATITADGTKTITEWGLFSASTAGTAWSLRCFTGIPLLASDGIEFTYTLTVACVSG